MQNTHMGNYSNRLIVKFNVGNRSVETLLFGLLLLPRAIWAFPSADPISICARLKADEHFTGIPPNQET